MIKKIITGTLLAILIGGLVYGAWYRTTAKAANEAGRTTAERRGQESNVTEEHSTTQSSTASQQGAGYRGGGNAQGNAAATGNAVASPGNEPSPQAEVTELVNLAGSVTSVSADLVTIAVAGQAPVELSGRSLTFATEQGFVIQPGDSLQLTGFYEESDFEIQAIQNLTTGQALALREESGRPLWAGGGRRGG